MVSDPCEILYIFVKLANSSSFSSSSSSGKRIKITEEIQGPLGFYQILAENAVIEKIGYFFRRVELIKPVPKIKQFRLDQGDIVSSHSPIDHYHRSIVDVV